MTTTAINDHSLADAYEMLEAATDLDPDTVNQAGNELYRCYGDQGAIEPCGYTRHQAKAIATAVADDIRGDEGQDNAIAYAAAMLAALKQTSGTTDDHVREAVKRLANRPAAIRRYSPLQALGIVSAVQASQELAEALQDAPIHAGMYR